MAKFAAYAPQITICCRPSDSKINMSNEAMFTIANPATTRVKALATLINCKVMLPGALLFVTHHPRAESISARIWRSASSSPVKIASPIR